MTEKREGLEFIGIDCKLPSTVGKREDNGVHLGSEAKRSPRPGGGLDACPKAESDCDTHGLGVGVGTENTLGQNKAAQGSCG